MGTKNNPGRYDCHSRAHPDEPTFTLLGRDPLAASLVHLWAMARTAATGKTGEDEQQKQEEARDCAISMEAWCASVGRTPASLLDCLPADLLLEALRRRGATVVDGTGALSEADYLLVCSIEEASEVIQRGCKSLRFGALEVQPGQAQNNAQRFTGELLDLRAALDLLRERTNYIDEVMQRKSVGEPMVDAKKAKIAKFMDLSRAEGRLQGDASAPACPTCAGKRVVPAEGAGQVIAGAKCPETLPCPACSPSEVGQRLRAPVQPDDVKTEAFDDSPLARARRAVASEGVIESHASCRELLKALVAQVDGETLP
jgi:hypothetical protein